MRLKDEFLILGVENGDVVGIGIDIAPQTGRVARNLFSSHPPAARVCFVRASAEALPFETSIFDLAICRIALACMNNSTALAEISRILRPNGILLLKIIHARYYLHEFSRGLLSRDVRKISYAARVLLAGAIYHLCGRQPRSFPSGETLQTRWMLRRELARCGLSNAGETPESEKVTPCFVIIKDGSAIKARLQTIVKRD